ncbi:MAG: hypothetical protein GY847_03895 [Proteobacteria bacterium]|nr:hypothetical protein [Pseudomonadota bacterium]
MSGSFDSLMVAAIAIGFIHTAAGPDHYLPFIVIAKARGWSLSKTALITVLCGVGHVASSIILGVIGIVAGMAVGSLEVFESYRGNLAAWALIAFGLIYMVWGIRRAINKKPHTHLNHQNVGKDLTPWLLFTIFIFGPCEPLIPLLMYPASQNNLTRVGIVAATFGLVTIGTMLGIVLACTFGLRPVRLGHLEPYKHSLAGGTILASGLAIRFLGL